MRTVGRWLIGMLCVGAFLSGGTPCAQAAAAEIDLTFVHQWYVEGEPGLLAVDATSGDVLVNINQNHRIFRYSAEGEFLSVFGREGEIPAALAVDVEGLALVAVNINNNWRIIRYDRFGNVVAEWEGEGEVGGIAAHPEGYSLVAVNINNNWHVVKYGPNGESYPDLADEWARQLGSAVAIAADPNGGTVVAVNINNNWHVFRYGAGHELLTSWQVVAGVIETNGIAVGPNGTVFVNINNSHCTVMYGAGGEPLGEFGAEGTEPGQFLYPSGIAVTATGLVYVADSGNHRIQVFVL